MDRKDFVARSLQLCLATGAYFFTSGARTFARSHSEKPIQNKEDHEQLFKENWITSLLTNLVNQFDKNECKQLMVACGRDCARRGAVSLAQSCFGDLSKLVTLLDQIPRIKVKQQADKKIHLIYETCLCELVSKGPERLPDTYCLCSTGWIHEMFETITQKPVTVQLLQTVKQGGDSCQFIIQT